MPPLPCFAEALQRPAHRARRYQHTHTPSVIKPRFFLFPDTVPAVSGETGPPEERVVNVGTKWILLAGAAGTSAQVCSLLSGSSAAAAATATAGLSS